MRCEILFRLQGERALKLTSIVATPPIPTSDRLRLGSVERFAIVPAINGSFKGANGGSPGLDEITLIRLKNAERRRLEEKIRKEEAAAAAAAVGE